MSPALTGSIPIFDPTGRYVTFGAGGDVKTVDLVTMKSRVIAKDVEGVVGGAADGHVLGYVAKDGLAHVHAGDGAPRFTFRPEILAHSLVFSDAGDRIGALSEHEVVVHDVTGKTLYGMTLKSSLALFVLRGEDTWMADPDGVLRHYRGSHLIASLPSHLVEAKLFAVAGNLAVTLAGDGSLAMSRADAAQLHLAPRPCQKASFAADGIAVSYQCGDDKLVFVGSQHVATIPANAHPFVTYDRGSQRAAVSTDELVVFEHGKPIARTREPKGHLGAVTFEDRDHVLVVEPEERFGVWRWTFAEDRWEHVAPIRKAVEVTVARGGIFVGTDDGFIVHLRDGREVGRVAVGGRVAFLVTSGDRRWVTATLSDGGTAILDGQTGALARRLEPADALSAAATLDESGDLMIRSGRGTMTVWDRSSGEALVFTLDLLDDMTNAAFATDGRIEVAGRQVGVLDLPRERRPASEIVREITCKVPLRVRDGKLEPAVTACPVVGAP
ncbi:MAG: hypothetical protein H0X17_12340 [Deltaproteobacteria bacterium]|nr:hypothetical protein [Deltaproteobacteria bacterium]